MSEIFFITHFPVGSGPNPDIIAVDLAKVNDILLRLPPYISILAQRGKKQNIRIICGTGLRHLRTAKALGLIPTHYSPCVGCPDIILPEKKVLLANGVLVDEEIYSLFADDPEICKHMLQPLANGRKNSIIITDPYLVRMLGAVGPEPGQVFHTMSTMGEIYTPYQL